MRFFLHVGHLCQEKTKEGGYVEMFGEGKKNRGKGGGGSTRSTKSREGKGMGKGDGEGRGRDKGASGLHLLPTMS
jgi:hypothetical protein